MDAASEWLVEGMTCTHCARRVSDALRAVPGVASVVVRLESRRALVRPQPGTLLQPADIIEALQRAGYSATAAPPSPPASARKPPSALEGWRFNVWFGSTVTLLLGFGEWLSPWGAETWFQWLALFLALPVQLFCGARFYRGAWRQLRAGSANMDTLVALGSTTAFAFSAWQLLSGHAGHAFFFEAAAIITLISVGHWLEALTSRRAASALQALLNLAPPTARRLGSLMQETEVPAADLRINDQVVLRPGDRVPVDGVVAFGASAVDETMLTGESLPVEKQRGSRLYAGTVNLSGRLVMRVTAVGEDTALAHIIAVVERAQNSRAAIQKLGDRISSVFVPVVVAVALATGLWWGLAYESASAASQWLRPWLWPAMAPPTALAAAFIQAVAVLIVACPCAMGLATPVAIMAGANVAARRGLLVRDGQALEKCGRLTAVVFDKTGTLTTGKVEVSADFDARPASAGEPSLANLAAALAQPSSHPFSQALARRVLEPLTPLEDWREWRGRGVQARLPGASVPDEAFLRLGSLAWLRENGVDLAPLDNFRELWTSRGASVLGLSQGRRLLGGFALRDSLKPHAAAVVKDLAESGLEIFLVTGDQERTARALAQAAGVPPENVFAETPPEEKAAIIRRLQEQGRRVAFVGDGINDAPALKQADLGIAVSRASDVAREAADLILLNSDLAAIPEALALAQATLRTVKQNLFWAFFYNAAAIPLAALGFLNPVLCAATMGLSDLLVIGNALRLNRWQPPPKAPREQGARRQRASLA